MSVPSSRLIKTKNATFAMTANADILFSSGGSIRGWSRILNNRIKEHTEGFAPTNKRPRWGHYGKPLKQSFVTTRVQRRGTKSGNRLYAAVGSTAPYARYVDQGTGVHGGNGPYEAKILPPWEGGGYWLWEHTWRPPGSIQPLGTKTVRGQVGQRFFEKGLNRAFDSMMRRGQQVPTDPMKIGAAIRSWPRGLENFVGNTPADSAFLGSLERWRAERDAAFKREAKMRNSVREHTGEAQQRRDARAKQAREDRAKAKSTKKPRVKKITPAQDKKNFRKEVEARFGAPNIESISSDGLYWEAVYKTKDSRGRVIFEVYRRKKRS